VNFTAIERKITQRSVPVLFLRTFTQQKHTFGHKGRISYIKISNFSFGWLSADEIY
jgi:hypothetical protein